VVATTELADEEMSGVRANIDISVDSMALQSFSPRRAEVGDSTADASTGSCFHGQAALHQDMLNFGAFRIPARHFVPEDSAGIPFREAQKGTHPRTSQLTTETSHNVDTNNAQHYKQQHQQGDDAYLCCSLSRQPSIRSENTTTRDTWQKEDEILNNERRARLALDSSRLISLRGMDNISSSSSTHQQQQQQQQSDQLDDQATYNDETTQALIDINDFEDSVDQKPGSDMGYTNTIHSAPWGQSATMKVDSAPFQANSEGKDRDEDGCSAASTASATTMSPTFIPLYADLMEPGGRHSLTAIGTPSTVSTAFSTDDVSADGTDDFALLERLSLKMDESLIVNPPMIVPRNSVVMSALRIEPTPTTVSNVNTGHGRSASWDSAAGLHQHDANTMALSFQSVHPLPQRNQWARQTLNVSPKFGPAPSPHGHDAWGTSSNSVARVATFRPEGQLDSYNHSQLAHTEAWNQQRRFGEQQHFMGQHAHGHTIQQDNSHLYRPQGLPPRAKAQYTTHAQVASMTPPRSRNPRPGQPTNRLPTGASPMNPAVGPLGGANPPRSASEILKTLLRKKACLYEPDTSRAVALVTWLVGRELALAYGYFSRQQLQSGVHACVASKIDSGTITRTKVNRCMQIILNSCFHYIIPRPDGSEENGEAFITVFGEGARDSATLLSSLPPPWNDIKVDKETVLNAADTEDENDKKTMPSSPQASPRFSPIDGKLGDMDPEGKRAVLLCFNENVRSAEDVFRCHNEFIRDTANASKLQLTAHEWRAFFGKDALDTPMMWGGSEIGIKGQTATTKQYDHLGRMNRDESQNFRTTWCAKRYDHDHSLCGFAHVEVNGGWLRRDPSVHNYFHELCKSLITVGDKRPGHKDFMINACGRGVDCQFCHSREEMLYHPDHYKVNVCVATSPQGHGCILGDICPYFHSSDSILHQTKKHLDGRHQRHRHSSHHSHSNFSQGRSVGSTIPEGAPMLYVHPAPLSNFEKQLTMPGLQSLFRRHSAVVRAHLHVPIHSCTYSAFGDDWGIAKGDAINVKPTAMPTDQRRQRSS